MDKSCNYNAMACRQLLLEGENNGMSLELIKNKHGQQAVVAEQKDIHTAKVSLEEYNDSMENKRESYVEYYKSEAYKLDRYGCTDWEEEQ